MRSWSDCATWLRKTFCVGMLFVILGAPTPIVADDDAMRVRTESKGPYDLTIYSQADPRYGQVDLAILVQKRGSTATVPDATVSVLVESLDRPGEVSQFDMTPKTLASGVHHAVEIALPHQDRWLARFEITSALGTAATAVEVDLRERSLLRQPDFQILLLALPAFFVMWRLDRIGKPRRRSSAGESSAAVSPERKSEPAESLVATPRR